MSPAPTRPPAARHALGQYLPYAALALVVGLMAAVMYSTDRSGHWWGDDWALYLRQAKGLLDGHPNRVLVENEFTVGFSDGSEFSPPLYPWGFPLMLAPFVALFGENVDRLMVVPVTCAAVFACCWFLLARRRFGWLPAVIGIPAVTLTPLLLSWAELLQSEWPFLASAGVALVTLDHVANSSDGIAAARWRWLVLVGLSGAFAFTVRREGLATVGAVGFAQIAALIDIRHPLWRGDRRRLGMLAARLAAPHAAFLVAVGLLQVTLPSTVVPKYDGTSITNTWKLGGRLVRNLAQVSGLQRPWDRDPTVLGSTRLGWISVIVFLSLAAIGALMAVVRYRVRDVHLVAYAVGAYAIGGSFRSPINRYVCTVAPVLMLLALIAVYTGVRLISRRWVAGTVISLVFAALIVGNAANAKLRIEGAERANDAGAIEWGPTHPDAIAMFDAVEALTGPGEVVASPKARSMVLETGRPSIQVDDYRPIPPDVDVALIVVDPATKLGMQLRNDPTYTEVWSNNRFVLYEPAA